MNPQKTNAKRGFKAREAKRRAAQAARPRFESEDRMAQYNPPARSNPLSWIIPLVIIALVLLCCCPLAFGLGAWQAGWLGDAARTLVQSAPIENEPEYVAPAAETQPEAPAVPETTVPIAVTCNTPSIKAGLNEADHEFGEFLDTNLGKRMTYTSRRLLVPDKAWNVELTATELKKVEETWQEMSVCVPDGMTGVLFAGGFEMGSDRYDNGALLTLRPGLYSFRLRNAELVLWYPQQEQYMADDLDRIVDQIRTGNFDIKSPLAFFAATSDLMNKIPNDLVLERNAQIVAYPKPVVR